jgi:prepilin-type N-terminal cleavage/methylation domain-containing protein
MDCAARKSHKRGNITNIFRRLKMNKKRERRGFTLIELMVVILIVGILAAVAVPILRGRIEQAKWSEGAASAGAVKTAIRAYYADDPIACAALAGSLVSAVESTLGFTAGDLTGRYFTSANFTITSIDGNGNAVITVAAPAGLTGSGVLGAAGWVYTP